MEGRFASWLWFRLWRWFAPRWGPVTEVVGFRPASAAGRLDRLRVQRPRSSSGVRGDLGAGRRREGRVYPVATPCGAKIAPWYGRGRTSVAKGNHDAGAPG